MNYLSHFHLENSPASPYFTVGLVLPDLAGAAQRGWKPVGEGLFPEDKLHLLAEEPEAERGPEIIGHGVRRHLIADALFHNSDFFREFSRRLREELAAQGYTQPGLRLFFVAHILLEMMLDRLLLQSVPDLGEDFYSRLHAVQRPDLDMYFMHGSPLAEPERFHQFFGRFMSSRFLFSYLNDEHLLFSLNRILERARQPELALVADNRFADMISAAEEMLRPEVEGFFGDLRRKL